MSGRNGNPRGSTGTSMRLHRVKRPRRAPRLPGETTEAYRTRATAIADAALLRSARRMLRDR